MYFVNRLPTSLHFFVNARLASTFPSSQNGTFNPFPYPSNPQPTPYQIFHLSPGASQKDIKKRYYDLVRVHHPDSHYCRRLLPAERHVRFQSISTAYDILRGRAMPGPTSWSRAGSDFDPYLHELAKRRRAFHAAEYQRQHAEFLRRSQPRPEAALSKDDLKRERMLLVFGILAIMIGLYPGVFLLPLRLEQAHRAAVVNLTQAQDEAREVGEARLVEVRKRVKEIKKAEEVSMMGSTSNVDNRQLTDKPPD